MKILAAFKTPDALYYAFDGLTDEEREAAHEVCDKFVKNNEYVTIEFDIDKQTATVLTVCKK